jgi:hypothetical protein
MFLMIQRRMGWRLTSSRFWRAVRSAERWMSEVRRVRAESREWGS